MKNPVVYSYRYYHHIGCSVINKKECAVFDIRCKGYCFYMKILIKERGYFPAACCEEVYFAVTMQSPLLLKCCLTLDKNTGFTPIVTTMKHGCKSHFRRKLRGSKSVIPRELFTCICSKMLF